VIVFLGAIRYSLTVLPKADNHILNFNEVSEITVTGLVTGEPDVRDVTTNLLVEAESLSAVDGRVLPVIGQILVHVPRYPAIEYGSRLRITGQLKNPNNFDGFDYQQYLARRSIFSEMYQPDIVVLETGGGNPIFKLILAIKARAQEAINRLFPEPQAALLSGILLGYDRGLPKKLVQDFQTTGMTHIIAISGFNIAIIAGILLRGSRYFVSPRAAGLIAIVGISLYTILVGADSAVVRAAIMAALFIVALLFLGRPTFLYAALFAAALFMTLANPYALWDVGFQLSFMAVLGLLLYVGPWSKRISGKLEPRLGEDKGQQLTRMIADVFLATMAAIVMTLPIMLFHFDTFSLISPLANLLILPAQPGVMIIGGLATLLGMISPALGQLPAWVGWLFLTYTINLVRFFAALTHNSVSLSIAAGGVVVFYILIMGVTWITSVDKEKRLDLLGRSPQSRIIRALIGTGIIIALLATVWIWNQPDGKLHVTFLDVGQGDAIFIESPDGRQILVDGGRRPSLFLDQLGREMPFWDKDIDVVVATHPDEDHILGLVEALDHYRVNLLLVNGEEADLLAGYEQLLETAKEAQIPVRKALAGEVIELGDGVRLEILYPGPELDLENRNENSVSIRLVYGDFALLLTGDAEEKAERMMIESGRPLQSFVFKAGHHGSGSSSSRAFLQAVQPQIIVVSAGSDNNYNHPHPEMLQRGEEIGATILRTDELGSIEVISDGHQVWWETEAD
jgi:competence protein ComEC